MEVSESAFEYLLGELMELKDPKADESDQGYNRIAQRLDEMGFSVGYRCVIFDIILSYRTYCLTP